MGTEDFIQVLSDGCEPILLRAIRQHWYSSRWHKYLTVPRTDHGLLLLIAGGMEYTWDNGSLTLQPGDLIYLSKGSHYDVRMYTELGTVKTLLINFDLPDSCSLPSQPPQLLCSNGAGRFLKHMSDSADAFAQASAYLAKAHFYYLLSDLQQLLTRQIDSDAQILDQAMTLLQMEEVPTMDEIARQCRISESSLRRLFHRQLNISPAKFRSESKLRRACTLLISTDLTVEEIAAALHYTDSAYFCRCFSAQFGTTPSQYRNTHRPVL